MLADSTLDWRTLAVELFDCHDQVLEELARMHPSVDGNLLDEAFVETVMELSEKPGKFNPTRGNLVRFLAGATNRNLRDMRRSIEARRRRETKKGISHVAERTAATRDVLDLLADRELADIARKEAARTDEERCVLHLWELGETELSRYAHELGVTHLAGREQESYVKRIRDRVTKRLARMKERLEGSGQ